MATLLENICEELTEVNAGLHAIRFAISDSAKRDSDGDFENYTLRGQIYLLDRVYDRLDELIRCYADIEQTLLKERTETSCHGTCHTGK